MGSAIKLAVGKLEVDWGKDSRFHPHEVLFQAGDIRRVPYRYVTDEGEPISEDKPAYVKPLAEVLPRLELLGHTLRAARQEYEELVRLYGDRVAITFEQFAQALRAVEIQGVSDEYSDDHDFGEFFAEEIYDRLDMGTIVGNDKPWRRDVGEFMENLHPWSVLRLLAENPANLGQPVIWYFADAVDDGWVGESDIRAGLSSWSPEQFLVVTEGSSDAKIIEKALDLLRPEISDFFYFVDMEEGYPFTGTGNLHRFCQGLASIRILNKIAVVYDNDAEGASKCQETRALNLPRNMRILQLPDLPAFESFQTLGPNGRTTENVNGRAAGIECYLDLEWEATEKAAIRWTSYNEKLQRYQGELVNKNQYVRRFLSLRRREPGYDFTRLLAVLELLEQDCVEMTNPAADEETSSQCSTE